MTNELISKQAVRDEIKRYIQAVYESDCEIIAYHMKDQMADDLLEWLDKQPDNGWRCTEKEKPIADIAVRLGVKRKGFDVYFVLASDVKYHYGRWCFMSNEFISLLHLEVICWRYKGTLIFPEELKRRES